MSQLPAAAPAPPTPEYWELSARGRRVRPATPRAFALKVTRDGFDLAVSAPRWFWITLALGILGSHPVTAPLVHWFQQLLTHAPK